VTEEGLLSPAVKQKPQTPPKKTVIPAQEREKKNNKAGLTWV